MDLIQIEKKANCYTVEISGVYKYDGEDEEYLYKTKEEMVAALPELVDRAQTKYEADKAAYEEKKAKVV